MKKIFFLVCISFNLFIIAQEKPILVSGEISVGKFSLADVHIINKTLDIGTISNDEGKFELIVKKGDVLIISHINYEIKEYFVSTKDINNQKIELQLSNKIYVLNEVVIDNRKGIFHVDKDIMPHNLPIVNAKTLKLPYTESEAIKKEKLLKIKSLGASLNLDDVLNILSGAHKKEKQLKEAVLSDDNLQAIRTHFTDSFFTNQLHIKKEYINIFLNFNKSSGIIQLHKKNKLLELTAVLLENSKVFSQKEPEEKTSVSFNK